MHDIHIIGGGTISHVRCGLSLASVDFGETARLVQWGLWRMREEQPAQIANFQDHKHLTSMAAGESRGLTTVDDVQRLVERLVADEQTKILFLMSPILEFDGCVGRPDWNSFQPTPSGPNEPALRAEIESGKEHLILKSREPLWTKIRQKRKDIFLVAYHQTGDETEERQYFKALRFLKANSCNLVLSQNQSNGRCMVVTPEEARYFVGQTLISTVYSLVDMTFKRQGLTYSRTEVVDGDVVGWSSERIPPVLKRVVEYCIEEGAYKPLFGKTVGHFSYRENEEVFLVSRRGVDYNRLDEFGMVEVQISKEGQVVSKGAKPSAGAQTQRLIFDRNPQYDCIIHFHCPLKESSDIPVRSQYEYECGSIECGLNTNDGLKHYDGFSAVMLDKHGPNIVFHHRTDPQKIIDFIEAHCDLANKTGGYDPSMA